MGVYAILNILILIILAALFLIGRELYLKSVRVRQRLQMEKVFTNITHELLTPLTVVSASVDQLREESPEHDHQYDMMQMNIQRMVRLLQQILETSKSQAGELKLQVAYGDVMKYIYDTALCLQPLMTKITFTSGYNCFMFVRPLGISSVPPRITFSSYTTVLAWRKSWDRCNMPIEREPQ